MILLSFLLVNSEVSHHTPTPLRKFATAFFRSEKCVGAPSPLSDLFGAGAGGAASRHSATPLTKHPGAAPDPAYVLKALIRSSTRNPRIILVYFKSWNIVFEK